MKAVRYIIKCGKGAINEKYQSYEIVQNRAKCLNVYRMAVITIASKTWADTNTSTTHGVKGILLIY